MYIKNSSYKRNNFICFGAVHFDNVLQLKKKHYNYRTNPIIKSSYLGGVAYNIAKQFAILGAKSTLISLNCSNDIKNKIKNEKIIFKIINKKKLDRSYNSIINLKGEMILGLADMDNYEKKIVVKKNFFFNNNIIIFDLNFSYETIRYLVNQYYHNNIICICGTSSHKIYKINTLIKKIDFLILNKQESFNLSNKKNINSSLRKIIKKNNKLTIVITNGKNSVKAYHERKIYTCKPPKIKIYNENKAGDIMSSFFYYFFFKGLDFKTILAKSVIAGSLHASGYISKKNEYLKMIDKLMKNIKIKTLDYYE